MMRKKLRPKNSNGAIGATTEGRTLIISPRKSDRGLYVYQARPRTNSVEPSRFYEIWKWGRP